MQTTKDLVAKTFDAGGLLDNKIENYRVRQQQIDLSKKIQESIKNETSLIAEGPTGVGKSLAALVPAFEHIRKTDEPVIIVTSSIILQEQYMLKDIPLLEEVYNFNVRPVLIKGRNNYVCAKKLKDSNSASFQSSNDLKEFEKVKDWAFATKTGDKSELDFVPKHNVWSQVACVADNECVGKQCPLYNVCHYYRERNKVISSKLVVCNYHYFFSSIDTEARMLPPGARVLILDEGHEVGEIARDFQEKKYTIYSLRNQFDYFIKEAKKGEMMEHEWLSGTVNQVLYDMELDQVNRTLNELFVGLDHEYKRVVHKHYTRDFWELQIPERTRLQKYVREHLKALHSSVTVAGEYLDKYGFSMENIPACTEMYGEDAVEWLVTVYKTMDFLAQKGVMLQYIFAFDENQDDEDNIFWLQRHADSVSIHAKPTTGAGLIRELFRKKDDGYITTVMSATLSAAQSFDHLKREFGIDESPDDFPSDEIIISSPFDLSNNLLWYLPQNAPAGNERNHASFTIREMEKVIRTIDGRTLCLFTSLRNLREAKTYLNGVLPEHIRVISQEDLPRNKIIEYMKEHDHTVVLGTRSLFTGIDIQGPHLSAVLIDKLPFPMIGDPVNDYLMSQPRGFHKFTLPEAIISLKQGFGRLNRTVDDKGIVAIYDGRLSTANYKNKIFNSFDFKINATTDWNRVLQYIEEEMEVK